MSTLEPLERVAAVLRRLPGIGRRSAERLAFAIAVDSGTLLKDLHSALGDAENGLAICARCGNLTLKAENPCRLCTDPGRDGKVLCVVEDVVDLALIEKTSAYRGRYHVLRGKLSPGQGTGVAEIGVDQLLSRVDDEHVGEVILALNSDMESDATASFLRDALARKNIPVSRLARGMPAGSGLAYADHVTLSQALQDRRPF